MVKEQFSFREKSSTDMANYVLLNIVLLSLDKKHFVGGVFCDLQKAFDCVNHNILFTKLEFYGISGIANQLMRSYLNHRYQRVVMLEAESTTIYLFILKVFLIILNNLNLN
jgi:hypothetical protein